MFYKVHTCENQPLVVNFPKVRLSQSVTPGGNMSFVATGVGRTHLANGERKLVRANGKQILLLEVEGKTYAIANRCPHEGYPLSEGTLNPGCLLTCNWHNWKFDL